MNVNISSLHFKADSKLEEFTKEKIQKLSGFFDGVIESDVTLKLEQASNNENKIAEIKVMIPGNDLFAKKQAKTFEEAIDNSVDALRKQLLKRKEKIKGNRERDRRTVVALTSLGWRVITVWECSLRNVHDWKGAGGLHEGLAELVNARIGALSEK